MKLRWIAVILVLALSIGVSWDVYRWHAFQTVTKSDIGYWKWKFVFDKSSGKKR